MNVNTTWTLHCSYLFRYFHDDGDTWTKFGPTKIEAWKGYTVRNVLQAGDYAIIADEFGSWGVGRAAAHGTFAPQTASFSVGHIDGHVDRKRQGGALLNNIINGGGDPQFFYRGTAWQLFE